jgi:hypothetical protein
MACPICGGTERRPIALGLWQCDSAVDIPAHGPADGSLSNPGPAVRFLRCGHKYQDSTAREAHAECSCGTVAIGWCLRCWTSVCAQHSNLDQDSKRYCANCLAVNDKERNDAAQRRRAAEAARRAKLPSIGCKQLVDYLRGELLDGDKYVLRQVSGALLAHALNDLGIPRLYWTFNGLLGRRVPLEVGWRIWEERVGPRGATRTYYLDGFGKLRVLGFWMEIPRKGQDCVCPPKTLRGIRKGVIRMKKGHHFFVMPHYGAS